MFLEYYTKLCEYYVKDAKKISIRSSYPKINPKSEHLLEFVKCHGNYDLLFNEMGALIEWIYLDKNQRIICIYNEIRLLLRLEVYNVRSKFIYGSTNFYYDDKNRIISEVYQGKDLKNDDDFQEIIHQYIDNRKITILPPDYFSADLGTFTAFFNDENKLIEEKGIRNANDLIDWKKFEYSADGFLIKEISLDINGIPDGYYELSYNEKGLDAGYSYIKLPDHILEYSKERIYQYNEKGDWINHILTIDGTPQYIYDRSIEYY